MSRHFKHLTLDDRIAIQSALSICNSTSGIAKDIGFSRQAIDQEISRNRIEQGPAKAYGRHWNGCVYQRRCERRHVCGKPGCNKKCSCCRELNCVTSCDEYGRDTCPALLKTPFVCNGCPEYKSCAHIRYTYSAAAADARANGLLVTSRQGVDLTEDEMAQIREVTYPLLCQGLSPAAIWITNSDRLPCSERSFYRYVHQGLFDDICLLDLPMAARYAPRATHKVAGKTNISAALLEGRRFEDFLCLDKSTQESCVEMDTVVGAKGSVKSILTVLWRKWMFQMMILLENHTSEMVVDALDDMERALGDDDFPDVALSDRGSEFADALGLEKSCVLEEASRCAMYYCDPRRSDQKARCENNHRLIRRILPKGTGFDGLTAEDMSLISSHINSMPRKSLGGKSPMELAMEHLPEQFFARYGLKLIPSKQIILKPKLLLAR